MAKKKLLIVDVEYSASEYPAYDQKLAAIAKKFGAEERGAGMGFGVRDTSYDVPEQKAADFKKTMRSLSRVTSVKSRKYQG